MRHIASAITHQLEHHRCDPPACDMKGETETWGDFQAQVSEADCMCCAHSYCLCKAFYNIHIAVDGTLVCLGFAFSQHDAKKIKGIHFLTEHFKPQFSTQPHKITFKCV